MPGKRWVFPRDSKCIRMRVLSLRVLVRVCMCMWSMGEPVQFIEHKRNINPCGIGLIGRPILRLQNLVSVRFRIVCFFRGDGDAGIVEKPHVNDFVKNQGEDASVEAEGPGEEHGRVGVGDEDSRGHRFVGIKADHRYRIAYKQKGGGEEETMVRLKMCRVG